MSNLYRSAISAKLAKLPPDLPATSAPWKEDGDEESEVADTLGSLPGSGMGPPAM
jgi:protein phosphatase methylesterase 1